MRLFDALYDIGNPLGLDRQLRQRLSVRIDRVEKWGDDSVVANENEFAALAPSAWPCLAFVARLWQGFGDFSRRQTLVFDWHTKIEPHQDRIHVHPPTDTSEGRTIIGILHKHLPLPGD